MTKKENKIYCVECGAMNEFDATKCTKCGKNPNPKDHAFKDYVSGKFKDGAYSGFMDFIKKHLYGTLMTCSILFTGASILANTVFSDGHIEKVTERPTIKYVGEGLEAKEVVEKYVEALREGNYATVYGLQLEKVKSDVYKEVLDMSDNSSPDFGEKRPIRVHTLTKFADIYFKDDRSYQVGDYEEEIGLGKYGDYDYYRYNVHIIFCENNVCSNESDDDYSRQFWLTDQVEVINVDGNYYIIGEKHHYEQMNLDQIIMRGLIYNAQGDMTQVHLRDAYNTDICGEADDCMSKFSGMEVDQEW